ncbi:MAG: CBS domain-containing protein [Nitrospira sp.]|nr:CBS domain-containing protein [Nitrospira sp.]
MPIVPAISGIAETYPVKPTIQRPAHVESVEAQGDQSHHPPLPDHPHKAAHNAYQQQTEQDLQAKPALLARDLMSSPVYTRSSDSTASEAWADMTRRGIHHLPVTSVHGILVGIISDRDLLRQVPELAITTSHNQAAHRKLADLMTRRVVSAAPTTTVRDIARLMLDERIHAVQSSLIEIYCVRSRNWRSQPPTTKRLTENWRTS